MYFIQEGIVDIVMANGEVNLNNGLLDSYIIFLL
jgi:hypothetical protein